MNIWVDILKKFLNKSFVEKDLFTQEIIIKIINIIPWFESKIHS
jgi:hypothetical protein